MNPYDYIPKNELDKWKVSKNRVFKFKLAWIPMFDFFDDHINIFLDIKMGKEIIKLVPKIDSNLYMISPTLEDPHNCRKDIYDIHSINITNYLKCHSQDRFYDGFSKIGFDLIENMVMYCNHHKCLHLIKECYDVVNKNVQYKSYDYYMQKDVYECRKDIREDFNSLYRQIQLSQILV